MGHFYLKLFLKHLCASNRSSRLRLIEALEVFGIQSLPIGIDLLPDSAQRSRY